MRSTFGLAGAGPFIDVRLRLRRGINDPIVTPPSSSMAALRRPRCGDGFPDGVRASRLVVPALDVPVTSNQENSRRARSLRARLTFAVRGLEPPREPGVADGPAPGEAKRGKNEDRDAA
jgi:hypothetical protein